MLQQTKQTNPLFLCIVVSIISGLVGGAIAAYVINKSNDSVDSRIKNTYEDEIATFVSPTTLRKMIDQKSKNYILVDLRSKPEYDAEHIVTAINIPSVSMTANEIVTEFAKLPKNKQIIVHCYSASCTLGRTIGKLLAEHGMYVNELDVGWSEWRYHWDLWNPGQDPSVGKNYVVTSSSSATLNGDTQLPSPCTAGQFGC